MTKKPSALSRWNKNDDDGYIFMMALLVFIMLSATTLVILGATQNQLTQTTQNRQFTETRQGITAAVSDALNTLNNAGYATAMTNTSASTKKSGTAAKAKWWWYFDSATNTVNASATAYGKERKEAVKVDYSDVASTRDGPNGLPIYSASALGVWKDAVAFNASSTGALTVTGRIGLYGSARFISTADNEVDGDPTAISHDERAGDVLPNVTKTRDAITTVLDERTNKAIAANCSWDGVFSGGPVNADDPTIDCYTGFNVDEPIAITGSGVKTIVIRESFGNHSLAANVTTGVGQLHVIFAKRTANRELVIGSTISTPTVNGLFIYAPNMECSSIGQGAVVSGSLVCGRLTNFKSTINWLEPKLGANDGVTRRIWFQAP